MSSESTNPSASDLIAQKSSQAHETAPGRKGKRTLFLYNSEVAVAGVLSFLGPAIALAAGFTGSPDADLLHAVSIGSIPFVITIAAHGSVMGARLRERLRKRYGSAVITPRFLRKLSKECGVDMDLWESESFYPDGVQNWNEIKLNSFEVKQLSRKGQSDLHHDLSRQIMVWQLLDESFAMLQGFWEKRRDTLVALGKTAPSPWLDSLLVAVQDNIDIFAHQHESSSAYYEELFAKWNTLNSRDIAARIAQSKQALTNKGFDALQLEARRTLYSAEALSELVGGADDSGEAMNSITSKAIR